MLDYSQWGLPKIHHAATSPTLKCMSDRQMEKKAKSTRLYSTIGPTKLMPFRTGPEIFYRQGPDAWEIYDKMGITKNESCSHDFNFKMHSDCQIEKRPHLPAI